MRLVVFLFHNARHLYLSQRLLIHNSLTCTTYKNPIFSSSHPVQNKVLKLNALPITFVCCQNEISKRVESVKKKKKKVSNSDDFLELAQCDCVSRLGGMAKNFYSPAAIAWFLGWNSLILQYILELLVQKMPKLKRWRICMAFTAFFPIAVIGFCSLSLDFIQLPCFFFFSGRRHLIRKNFLLLVSLAPS